MAAARSAHFPGSQNIPISGVDPPVEAVERHEVDVPVAAGADGPENARPAGRGLNPCLRGRLGGHEAGVAGHCAAVAAVATVSSRGCLGGMGAEVTGQNERTPHDRCLVGIVGQGLQPEGLGWDQGHLVPVFHFRSRRTKDPPGPGP